MLEYQRIADNPHYVRSSTGFILNTNSADYSAALRRRKKQQETDRRIEHLEEIVRQLLEEKMNAN